MPGDFGPVIRTIEQALRIPVRNLSLVSGGMICRAATVETDAETFFVKWKDNAPEGFFTAEAHGLQLLRSGPGLRVPEVIAVCEESEGPAVLILENIPTNGPRDSRRGSEALGRGLAWMHREAIAPAAKFGLERDNFLGMLPQENGWANSWPAFYRERRLLPQIRIARSLGCLPLERERLLMQVLDGLEALLSSLNSRPALLHGDLWAGNYIEAGSHAFVCDPAVYYGEREMEIAYMELFGGFSHAVFAAYEEAYPLDAGYSKRRTLHQLYHLLNHLNHFGGSYGSDVDAACRKILA